MKKAKTKHSQQGPTPATGYRHDPSNVFANPQSARLEAHFLFERLHTLALLDRRPASYGHALLVLKYPVATLLEDIPREVKADVMDDLPVLMSALQAATGCDGIQVEQRNGPAAGQTVPQLIFHVKPCFFDKEKQELHEKTRDLGAAEAGPLIARICNSLPWSYSPGLLLWAPSVEDMESVGVILQQHLIKPGMVVELNGQLGAGKTTIARGIIRSFCKNPFLDVPSPTYLLCLSYTEDLGHDKAARQGAQGVPSVHHMDPYRLGANSDKMAGLIDFEHAFAHDVCVIEWPDRMPESVTALPRRGVELKISGTGVQGVGRLVQVLPLSPDDPSAETLREWRTSGVPPPTELALPRAAVDSGRQLLFPASASLRGDPCQWVVLGVESSCDDTAAAVVRGDGLVLAHEIASQAGLHEQYGGVKPDVARKAHADAIEGVVQGCLAKAGMKPEQLTAVAATVGPGLALCLQVGVHHALSLASQHRLPFLPIHHMEAHALITRMPGIMANPMTFPALLLLVSGGHNMLVLCQGVGQYRVVGTSLDDSVGECFDKVARLLGITAIPGGPKLEQMAAKGDPRRYKLTMPMQHGIYKDSCNFSFSGLKTSVARLVEEQKERLSKQEQANGEKTIARSGHDSDRVAEGYSSPMVISLEKSSSAANGEANGTAEHSRGKVRQQEPVPSDSSDVSGVQNVSLQPPDRTSGQGDTSDPFETVKADIAAGFQSMSVKFLRQRTARALQWMQQDCRQHGGTMVTCLVVAGGVAANKAVREAMDEVAVEFGIPCVYPPIKYCTDNGLMVAWAGMERLKLGLYKEPPSRSSSIDDHVEVVPRWPIGPLDPRSSVKGGVLSKMYK